MNDNSAEAAEAAEAAAAAVESSALIFQDNLITQNDLGQYIFDDSYDIAIDDCIIEFMDDDDLYVDDDDVCLMTVDIEHMTAQKVIESFIDQIGHVCGLVDKHKYAHLILDFEDEVYISGKSIRDAKDVKYEIETLKVDIVIQLKSFYIINDHIVPDLVLKVVKILGQGGQGGPGGQGGQGGPEGGPPPYSEIEYMPRHVQPLRPMWPIQPEKFDSHVLDIPDGQTGLHNMIDAPFNLWSVITPPKIEKA